MIYGNEISVPNEKILPKDHAVDYVQYAKSRMIESIAHQFIENMGDTITKEIRGDHDHYKFSMVAYSKPDFDNRLNYIKEELKDTNLWPQVYKALTIE